MSPDSETNLASVTDITTVGGQETLARPPRKKKNPRTAGDRCIWPLGARRRYGISGPTLWRWEKKGWLPARDFCVNGVPVGWRPETLDAADRKRAA
jgi:hypothetical protein